MKNTGRRERYAEIEKKQRAHEENMRRREYNGSQSKIPKRKQSQRELKNPKERQTKRNMGII